MVGLTLLATLSSVHMAAHPLPGNGADERLAFGLPPGNSPLDTSPGECSNNWSAVNDGAFNIPSNYDSNGDPVDPPPANPYSSEEGFEVLVFKGQLYVGMEADNKWGARLWRTKAGVATPTGQDDWEEVAADVSGYPFGLNDTEQNDHIDSLAEFDGYLYASTANRSGVHKGSLVYRSASGDADSWTLVNTAGFGDVNNENFKDMVVFTVDSTDWLCGGTANSTTGAEVWCTMDGTNWSQKNTNGFGSSSNALIASSAVFDNHLYFGVYNSGGGRVYRSPDLSSWTMVYESSDRPRVEIMDVLDGYLYIAEGDKDGRDSDDLTIRIYRSSTGELDS